MPFSWIPSFTMEAFSAQWIGQNYFFSSCTLEFHVGLLDCGCDWLVTSLCQGGDFFLSKSPNSWPHRLFVILIFLLHFVVKGWKFVNAWSARLTKSIGAWRVSFLSYSLKVCATYCWPCLTKLCKTVTHLIQLNSSHATAVS